MNNQTNSKRILKTWCKKALSVSALTISIGVLSAPVAALDLKLAHIGTEDTAYHQGAVKFKELVEQNSDDLTVSIFANGVLGGEQDLFEQQMAGALDISIINPGLLSEFSKTSNIFVVPFMYRDESHWKSVLTGEPGHKIADAILKETNVRVLDYFGGGVRQIVSTQPIDNLDDLKGLKIRVDPTKPTVAAWSETGMKPTVFAYGEVYTGLQLGAIDGLLNEPEWIYRMRFHEVAKHIALSEHDITVRLFTISPVTWSNLSEEDKNAVTSAAQEAAKYARDLQLAEDKKSRELLQSEGAIFHEIDREKLRSMTNPALEKVLKEMELYETYQMIVNY